MTLLPVDTSNSVAVSDYLSKARDWLATAVEMTGPEQIAMAKAEIATAAEATKQLGLAKEIQQDATEMVRRADYALGKAIRKGQEEGTVSTGQGGNRANVLGTVAAPTDFASDLELYDRPSQVKYGILPMAEATPEQFEAALTEARAEGNLSRANVARKVKASISPDRPLTERIDEIRDLASKGASRQQIAKHFDVSEKHIAEITKAHGITTATELLGRRRRIDHNRVLDNVTEALEVAAISLRDIDPEALDRDEAQERLDSLTTSINALSKAVRKIKESFRD